MLTRYTSLIALFWAVILAQTAFSQVSNTGGYQQQPPPPTEFDPQSMPVAVDQDSTIQLIVSDYVLSKALKAALIDVSKVINLECITANGASYLVYKTKMKQYRNEDVFVTIPLYKWYDGKYYASSGGVTCRSINGCDCKICTGNCCFPDTSMRDTNGKFLAKVQLAVE
jgi:hypothetical protein